MESSDILSSCGFNRPTAKLELRDVPQLIECVTLHSTLLIVKAELDDIIAGLSDAGVIEALRRSPNLFKSLFVHEDKFLTAGMMCIYWWFG
jgi:hypothetical protein